MVEFGVSGKLDFWNFPDWLPSGNNVRDGAEPFWMRDPRIWHEIEPVLKTDTIPPKTKFNQSNTYYHGHLVLRARWDNIQQGWYLTLENKLAVFLDEFSIRYHIDEELRKYLYGIKTGLIFHERIRAYDSGNSRRSNLS